MTSTIRMWKTRNIPGRPLVSMVIASYLCEDQRRTDSLLSLLYCLKAQTYDNWEAIIVHDGPVKARWLGDEYRKKFELDNRILFLETESHQAKFGHPWRGFGISKANGVFIGMSNDDNLYAPTYFEFMLHVLTSRGADFAYCDMIHSHRQWRFLETKPKRSHIDVGGWIARASSVRELKWRDFGFGGDGTFVEDLIAKGAKAVKVPACLFMHN